MGCKECGKPKCNGECGCKSPKVLQINNPAEYITFHKVSIPAAMGDSTTNPPRIGAYRNALVYYEADHTSWMYSTDGIPTKLTNGLTDYNEAVNLPQINGHTLIGDQSSSDLGLQGELTAGANIQIDGNVISATGTTYTAGNGISISANDEISIDTSIVAELSDLPTVNDGTLTIQHNGTTKGTFTANQSTASTVNIETIYADDYISTSPIPTTVTTAMIEDEAVTTAKIENGAVTTAKIENGAVTTAKIEDGAVTAAKTAFGGNYSTSEVNTGFTWIDGKHIYKKTIDIGALPNSTEKSLNHGISNIERIIRSDGWALQSDGTEIPLPYFDNPASGGIVMYVTSSAIRLSTGSNRSSFSGYVTLYYTKTTD